MSGFTKPFMGGLRRLAGDIAGSKYSSFNQPLGKKKSLKTKDRIKKGGYWYGNKWITKDKTSRSNRTVTGVKVSELTKRTSIQKKVLKNKKKRIKKTRKAQAANRKDLEDRVVQGKGVSNKELQNMIDEDVQRVAERGGKSPIFSKEAATKGSLAGKKHPLQDESGTVTGRSVKKAKVYLETRAAKILKRRKQQEQLKKQNLRKNIITKKERMIDKYNPLKKEKKIPKIKLHLRRK